MDRPLSSRDVNTDVRLKQAAMKSSKPAPKPPAKLAQKEKDHPPPPPPEVLEPPSADRQNGASYLTGKCLGKGGFAICYEGQLAGTRKKYALKIVKSHMPLKKMEQKFQTELQIHSKMDHANIVKFYRAFSFEKCTYIVLELCPNGSLMDMVKKRKFITEPEVRFWTVQMAGAIKYMHAKGIIHRDLKMGNIFLDKDMNVKVGDFGLAALLMSGKDMNNVRRTTLCGTPNYIAPEILEKGKGGHDHMVDIWSLGIIIFAMLTGKPPFQSTTADEIYRRAREREYDWPKLDTSENFISEETKELVSTLLQGPDMRPDPDTIVQHPFFTCGWMPDHEEMTVDLRDQQPHPNQFSASMRSSRGSLFAKNLKKLCVKCEVGPWAPPIKYRSTYKEVAAEEKARLTPMVPLAEDIVYRPWQEWLQEQQNQNDQNPRSDFSAEPSIMILDQPSPQILPRTSSIRHTAQSFAAQQRSRPGATSSSSQSGRSGLPINRNRELPLPPRSSTELSSRPLISLPRRSAKTDESRRNEPRMEPSTPIVDVENRLAADLAQQMNQAEVERKSQESAAPVVFTRTVSIFSPPEKLKQLRETKPEAVLEGARRLLAELDRALNARTMAFETKSTPQLPSIVVKWVDYTNKYGFGYILNNGTVGTVVKGKPDPVSSRSYIPLSCFIVRDAEQHLLRRNDDTYKYRNQLVPLSGHPLEFYENRGVDGYLRSYANPRDFEIPEPVDNILGTLPPGRDQWDMRKKGMVTLWKKFANYMISNARDYDEDSLEFMQPPGNSVATDIIIFVQRWGDVGCWVFADGHYQFNFPDHTKVILSEDGSWCNFYHLSLEAAHHLATRGELPPNALDERQQLFYPTQTLLNFMAKPSKSTTRKRPEIDPMIQGIPQANEFRKKIEFIRDALREWMNHGGIGKGDKSPEGRLKWVGMRQTANISIPYKCVWGTTGAVDGDHRVSAWYDPTKPLAIVPDIRSST